MEKSTLSKIQFLLLSITFLFLSELMTAQNTPLPYFNGFENPSDTATMTFKTRKNATPWVVGSAQHCLGFNSLYTSPDSGSTATYSCSASGYVSLAYIPITLPQGTYTLAFDYMMGGDGTNQAMKVAWAPSSVTLIGSSTGGSFPQNITVNQFSSSSGQNEFTSSAWTHVTGQVSVSTAGTYNLCFAFRCNSQTVVAPGACVDNVQIDTIHSTTDCLATPSNITVVKDAQAGVIVCWNGNATSYDVVAASASDPDDYSFVSHNGVTANCDTFQYSELGEGQYFFYVRPICGNDTGIFAETSGHLIYDVSAHCIDFVTLNAPGTQCMYGSYSNPYQTVGVIDNGPSQQSSRHTVHTDLNETDPRTLGALHTIPPGEIMSVRLGNWNNGAEAESITYTYNVPTGSSIILMVQYAVVFEEPGHAQPPEFRLEIMNANNQLLDSVCTYMDVLCDGTLTQGWHSCTYDNSDVWYKDWTKIGVNLTNYAGQTVKIRLTSYDCNFSGHFGYGYFTLDCTQAEVTGISCGAGTATEIKAPEGFNYQWINNCTGQQVSTARSLPVAGSDTCLYTCICSFKEQPSCNFSLTAYTIPRLPEASFTYTLSHTDCQTHVTFTNTSFVYAMQGGQKIILPNEKLTSQTWLVQSANPASPYHNQSSFAKNLPTIDVPKEGDVLTITLIGVANGCDDDTTIVINIPPLQDNHGVTNRYVCIGQTVVFNQEQYTFISADTIEVMDRHGQKRYITGKNSVQIIDTLSSWCGCDSILELNLKAMVPTFIAIDTMIWSDQDFCLKEYDVHQHVVLDTCLRKTGYYEFHIPSSLGSCDTLVYYVNLTVKELPKYLCFTAEDATASIALNQSGNALGINLCYSTDECETWQPYSIGQGITLSYGEKVYFSATYTNANFNWSTGYYYFSMVGNTSASGNIMSLLDATMEQTSVPPYAFYHLFQECASLTTAPLLPATTLSNNCYEGMFAGCTSLQRTPDLPASTLADNCYANMFERCVSLDRVTSLPASSLAYGCYSSMFINCISLRKAPALPVTLLADNCYNSMYKGCSSLTNVPELPASALTNGCYSQMFMDCSSLSINTLSGGTEWRIPAYAIAPDSAWNNDMFKNTGGQFTGDPVIGTTYFIFSDTLTAVENVSVIENDILWPNPVHVGQTAYISIDSEESSVEIYTISGLCVNRIDNAANTVAIEGLNAPGLYIVKVTDKSGKTVVCKLLVE